jgi:hypothetical protein
VPRAERDWDVLGTTECRSDVAESGQPAAESVEAVGAWARGVVRRWLGHQGWGVADTKARPGGVRSGHLGAAGDSREVPVALGGVTDETGAKCDDPREAGGHAVAVGVAGDEMVCE